MRSRYQALGVLLLIYLGLAYFCQFYWPRREHFFREIGKDVESQLAAGYRVSLLDVDKIQLEMIPGVGSSLSDELVKAQGRLKSDPNKEKTFCDFLLSVRGIGEKKCASLKTYLRLPQESEDSITH